MKIFKIILIFFSIYILSFIKCKAYSYFPLHYNNKINTVVSLSPMLDKVLPSVVSIYTKGIKNNNKSYIPREFKNFFRNDFPEYNKKKYFEGLGSGVIINANNGYIITNNHVINGANNIKIKLNSGEILEAKLVGKDDQTDIALLKINNLNNIKLIEIKLSNSDYAKVGDFVVAIGNPFGLGQTVTSGIISAIGRSGLNITNGVENFIQTDASINKGNSGGALINLYGELIGINTAILAPNGVNIGIGFAIPSNIINYLSKQLIKYGKVKRGYLGIKGTELNSDIINVLKIKIKNGVFVSEVIPKSSADKYGIKSGDIIFSINNKEIKNFLDLKIIINTTPIDKFIKIGIIRNDSIKNILLKLENNKEIIGEKIKFPIFNGVLFLNSFLKDGTKTVKIINVIKNSKASEIGLKKGDFIISINNNKIYDINQIRNILKNKKSIIILNILRNDSKIFILIK